MNKKINLMLWKIMKIPPRVLYAIGLGPLIGRFVLLLTTTGRKSGKHFITPLQYEMFDGGIAVASARGVKADWYRNIVANPQVKVRIGSRRFEGIGETVTDPGRIADYLEGHLRNHPKMMRALLKREGYPGTPDRTSLEAYATQRVMVVIRESKQ